MGIKNFTRVFPPKGVLSLKNLKGSVIAIDAMGMLYSASTGANMNTLTDKNGAPTLFISVIYSRILNFHKSGIKQVWVLDYKSSGAYHIPAKENEMKKRREKKKKALEKIAKLEEQKNQLFSSSEDEEKAACSMLIECNKQLEKYKKHAFRVTDTEISTLIRMLDWFGIKWIIAPKGHEAEQICAMATYDERILGVKADYALSSDADCLAFGAVKMAKYNTKDKKYYEFNLEDILKNNNITIDDLVKISVILGCDFADKTPGIGEKTVLKKFRNVVLTDEQKVAVTIFQKTLSEEEMKSVCVHNNTIEPFSDYEKFEEFMTWITEEKSFNKTRVLNAFKKVNLYTEYESNAAA